MKTAVFITLWIYFFLSPGKLNGKGENIHSRCTTCGNPEFCKADRTT